MFDMTIDIEKVLERAFVQAFSRALDHVVQTKTEELVKQSLSPGSPLAKKLEEKIAQGFERFLQEDIRWEKKKGVFQK